MRLLLVDDHALFRQGASMLLGDAGHEVVGQAPDGRDAVQQALRLKPDVVVMDVVMPRLNGVDATRQLLGQRPEAQVLALSQFGDRQRVAQMLGAGARGYVTKATGQDALVEALEAMEAGKRYVSPDVAAMLEDGRLAPTPTVAARPHLGAREREVLQLLAEGHTSPQIARQLHVSVKTVEAHRRNIMRKLDCHTVAELTKYAVRTGITALEP
jgi:two-component system NarL family response regulator